MLDFGGAGDADAETRERIRGLLNELGILRKRGVKLWAGRSPGGRPCAACGRDLAVGEVEYEILIGNMVTILLHRHCFGIWASEVDGKL